MLRIVSETITDGGTQEYFSFDVSAGVVAAFCILAAAVFIAFYLLRSIGIYKLAKNQGIEKAYIAFIPGVWMFTACKIIGKTRFFGTTAEKAALWVCIIFSCAVAIPFIYNFIVYFPYAMYYLQGGTLEIINGSGIRAIDTAEVSFNNLFDTPAINAIINVLDYADVLFRIAEIFITVTVYIALFKMFWPERYILASVLSFFGLFPIFSFAIRNRKAIDFNEYIRQRYYGAGYTPYGNNYYNNQANSQFNNQPNNNSDPFEEFSNRPDEPFGEFSDDNKSNNQSDNKDDFFS